MPYKDREQRNAYMREWRAKKKREKLLEDSERLNDLAKAVAEANKSLEPIRVRTPLRPTESPNITQIVKEPTMCERIQSKGFFNLTTEELTHVNNCEQCGKAYALKKATWHGVNLW